MSFPRIALIGCGNMGRSLAGGLVRAGWGADAVHGVDPEPDQRDKLRLQTGVNATADGAAAVSRADVVILAVKPQGMKGTVLELAQAVRQRQPLVITVAAGVRIESIHAWIGASVPLVRAMPNTPALLGAGATGLYCTAGVSAPQRQMAERILGAVGIVQWVEREELLDVITALSGSGPAYFFLLMEGLIQAGVELGLTPAQATALTVQTALGAARMAATGTEDPMELRRRVTSPGGTTEQGVRVLEESGLREILARAVEAARRRAEEMSGQAGEG